MHDSERSFGSQFSSLKPGKAERTVFHEGLDTWVPLEDEQGQVVTRVRIQVSLEKAASADSNAPLAAPKIVLSGQEGMVIVMRPGTSMEAMAKSAAEKDRTLLADELSLLLEMKNVIEQKIEELSSEHGLSWTDIYEQHGPRALVRDFIEDIE